MLILGATHCAAVGYTCLFESVYVETKVLQVTHRRTSPKGCLSHQCSLTQVQRSARSTGWHCYEAWLGLQSGGNNQFMGGVLCQKRGNINFFAPGNRNIYRKDINTVSTQTPTPTHRPH